MQQRTQRVAELVRASVGTALVRLLPQSYLTVTQVEVSPDIKYASVWISQVNLREADSEVLMAQLEKHRHELQQQLAGSLKTKFTPKLRLFYDDGSVRGRHIDELLGKL